MTIDILISGFELNMAYTSELVKDVREEDMTACPGGFTNHPAFTIGHLVSANNLILKTLGHPMQMPDGWDALFRRKGPGDPTLPSQDKELYPRKEILMEELDRRAELIKAIIKSNSEIDLSRKFDWKLGNYMPTYGHFLFALLHHHHAWHIGQLAEWRRLMGYDSALSKVMDHTK